MSRISAVAVFCCIGLAFAPSFATEPDVPVADKKPPAKPKWPFPSNDNRTYLVDLRQIRQEFVRFENDRERRDNLVQMFGTQYSFIGRYQRALEAFDDRPGGNPQDQPGALSDYEPHDAVATVLELADWHQVIMVNEAHHVPLHRAFTIQLLEGLYRKGFRYFAAETLTAQDEELQTRGYPTLESGYYLKEPLYGDLVRIAMGLGYEIVRYEFEQGKGKQVGEPLLDENFIETQNAREEGQARNLKERILDKDPQAKVLVHAGYAHIAKKPATWDLGEKKGEVRFMAVSFRKLTGIEPLAVDQTMMTERSKPAKEAGEYREAVVQGLLKDKAIVLRRRGERGFFTDPAAGYDLLVFHPRTRYERGRPTWMSLGGRRKAHSVEGDVRPGESDSYLAQTFYAAEQGPEAVPVDQMEFAAGEPLPTLWLPSGEFRVRIIDESGETLLEYSTSGSP